MWNGNPLRSRQPLQRRHATLRVRALVSDREHRRLRSAHSRQLRRHVVLGHRDALRRGQPVQHHHAHVRVHPVVRRGRRGDVRSDHPQHVSGRVVPGSRNSVPDGSALQLDHVHVRVRAAMPDHRALLGRVRNGDPQRVPRRSVVRHGYDVPCDAGVHRRSLRVPHGSDPLRNGLHQPLDEHHQLRRVRSRLRHRAVMRGGRVPVPLGSDRVQRTLRRHGHRSNELRHLRQRVSDGSVVHRGRLRLPHGHHLLRHRVCQREHRP